ncbi:MAG: hypothetical protein HQL84_16800 [Magnetococcales bacterium]|nr:hypothetical protein [Magnetococcales bacterium]MBF0151681.1 hypothetical protein [Magnetococcales bacterium]MBF0171966.1 hypothetical protein [Magnetococcales bacterium]MBF0348585.1 hypothetical protein [Magnetococcales bacterium]MBF0631189.1 hypothetical protein [Magnetococcales bacterium]
MSLTGLNNVNAQAAKPPEQVLDKIRNLASELNTMFDQKGTEGAIAVSDRAKSFSKEAFQISLQGEQLAQGAFYAKPR